LIIIIIKITLIGQFELIKLVSIPVTASELSNPTITIDAAAGQKILNPEM